MAPWLVTHVFSFGSPERFPGLGIDGQQVRLVAGRPFAAAFDRRVSLQDLQVQLAVVQQRRGAEGPQKCERSKVFGPLFFAFDVQGDHFAIAIEKENQLAVRDR